MPSVGTRYSHNDYLRERELFRYCQSLDGANDLDSDNVNSSADGPPISPNAALTALAQLCALRLDAPRAMISVVDKETQYFIAEATKTLMLSDTRKSERQSDGLWVGCTSVPKEGRLCEVYSLLQLRPTCRLRLKKTIELPPILDKYPCFTVTDLTADERFCELPFVTGPPHFRFYAGTPLTTENGINIGSLFIIDDRVRPELTEDQVDCLGTIAKIVMQTMQVNSEAAERRRSLRMSQGLQSFQDGSHSLEHEGQHTSDVDYERFIKQGEEPKLARFNSDKIRRGLSEGRSSSDTREPSSHKGSNANASLPVPSQDTGPHLNDDSVEKTLSNIDQLPNSTFLRAANLLRESLDLESTGGVVFYKANAHHQSGEATALELEGSEDDVKRSPRKRHRASASSGSSHEHRSFSFADVLSFSTAEYPWGTTKELEKVRTFNQITENLLQRLLHRYPRGKSWLLDDDGSIADGITYNASSKIFSPTGRSQSSQNILAVDRQQQSEASRLRQYFPGVRQLLLVPLWDSSAARWSGGCFCYATTSRQVFSLEGELSYLMTFGNSVMAEANRLAYIAAERQKGDFIGSISHELRSPLHGILASAEFLAETEFDAFQNSLVDTISSCGRTLLDTVNHILDYSKINKYERSFFNARKSRAQKSTLSRKTKSAVAVPNSKEAPPLMNIYATTDVAAIAEEVIEGVYAGQVYQDISSTEIAYMSPETKGKIQDHGVKPPRRALQGDSRNLSVANSVEVILDIAKGDYVFTTQPGALRRILMNLFGNSLKYTNQGSIAVSIRLLELGQERGTIAEEAMLQILIQDTGKGISNTYLQNHLFTPFAQEDVLATGVGLGLSIVKSIVNMLNGTIEFESQLGKGTKVCVKVPLMRLPGTDTPQSTPSTITSNSSSLTSLQGLQSEHAGKTVVLYGFTARDGSEAMSTDRGKVLHSYITEWFGLKASVHWSDSADIAIVSEEDLSAFYATNTNGRPTVVLCGTLRPQVGSESHRKCVTEFVSKPFGPYKLAKALFVCLEKAKGYSDERLDPIETFPPESPMSSDTGTIVPDISKLSVDGNEESSVSLLSATSPMSWQLPSEISSRSNLEENLATNQRTDFPFPSQDAEETSAGQNEQFRPDLVRQDSRRPKITHRATAPLTKTTFSISSAVTKTGEIATSTAAEGTAEISAPKIATDAKEAQASAKAAKAATPSPNPQQDRPPKLLLVDDNKINLRLLETFMRKRKYKSVDSAENGQLAVDAAMALEDGYDIIFMDISMPIMNGFEATRAIREIEHTRRVTTQSDDDGSGRGQNRALIIALTGLASSRDQTEAYKSGVDLFMTKPVSFKEVGRLLDNWEAHAKELVGEEMGARAEEESR